MAFVELIILSVIILFILHKWATSRYKTFQLRGVVHDAPRTLLGNVSLKVLFGKKSFLHDIIERYEKFKAHKVYGVYNLRDPAFLVTDLELIKRIGIKDFDHFPNQRTMIFDGANTLLSKSLLALRGKQWKEMRNTLTPTFTGSKMRQIYDLVNACSIEGVRYIEQELRGTGEEALEIEMKDFFTRYTNDVIASAAFGIKVNSFQDKTNEFYTIGKSVTQFPIKVIIKVMLYAFIPKIMRALRVPMFDKEKENYFGSLVLDAMKYRQRHKIVRPDMIQLLMEAKRQFQAEVSSGTDHDGEAHAEFSDEDLLAQCILFFFAGFDTVSTCLCFTIYELLMNPDVQQQLYEEISTTNEQLNGQPLNYDVLSSMKYMDMVISESLRKWPPGVILDRECVADIKMYADNGTLLAEFRKGDEVIIPVLAIQYDPEYYSDPQVFDPLRFSDERKHELKPFTYLPFGIGPRNCIGNRMALMEVKSIIYHLVLNFEILRAKKTVEDMMSDITGTTLIPKNLFWAKFLPRQKKLIN